MTHRQLDIPMTANTQQVVLSTMLTPYKLQMMSLSVHCQLSLHFKCPYAAAAAHGFL